MIYGTAFQIHTFDINDVACLSFESRLGIHPKWHVGPIFAYDQCGLITIDLCKNLAVTD